MNASAALIEKAQEDFESVLPGVERVAGHAFGYMDPEAREEAVAETAALAWQNHLQCSLAQKQVSTSSVAHYAVQNVRSGRCMAGSSSTDVTSPRTQVLGRASVKSYRETSPDAAAALMSRRIWERPFEAVRIKLDYGKFLKLPQVNKQERKVFSLIACGYTTSEIAGKIKISRPRVCQIKNSIGKKLKDFFGD